MVNGNEKRKDNLPGAEYIPKEHLSKIETARGRPLTGRSKKKLEREEKRKAEESRIRMQEADLRAVAGVAETAKVYPQNPTPARPSTSVKSPELVDESRTNTRTGGHVRHKQGVIERVETDIGKKRKARIQRNRSLFISHDRTDEEPREGRVSELRKGQSRRVADRRVGSRQEERAARQSQWEELKDIGKKQSDRDQRNRTPTLSHDRTDEEPREGRVSELRKGQRRRVAARRVGSRQEERAARQQKYEAEKVAPPLTMAEVARRGLKAVQKFGEETQKEITGRVKPDSAYIESGGLRSSSDKQNIRIDPSTREILIVTSDGNTVHTGKKASPKIPTSFTHGGVVYEPEENDYETLEIESEPTTTQKKSTGSSVFGKEIPGEYPYSAQPAEYPYGSPIPGESPFHTKEPEYPSFGRQGIEEPERVDPRDKLLAALLQAQSGAETQKPKRTSQYQAGVYSSFRPESGPAWSSGAYASSFDSPTRPRQAQQQSVPVGRNPLVQQAPVRKENSSSISGISVLSGNQRAYGVRGSSEGGLKSLFSGNRDGIGSTFNMRMGSAPQAQQQASGNAPRQGQQNAQSLFSHNLSLLGSGVSHMWGSGGKSNSAFAGSGILGSGVASMFGGRGGAQFAGAGVLGVVNSSSLGVVGNRSGGMPTVFGASYGGKPQQQVAKLGEKNMTTNQAGQIKLFRATSQGIVSIALQEPEYREMAARAPGAAGTMQFTRVNGRSPIYRAQITAPEFQALQAQGRAALTPKGNRGRA